MPEELLDPNTALGMLRLEHEHIKGLIENLRHINDAGMMQQALVPLLDELKIHSALELELFYPFIRQTAPEDKVEAAADEFDEVAILASDLDEMLVTDPAFKETLDNLITHFEKHTFQMEQYLFLTVEGPNCDPDCHDRLVALANDMKLRKSELLVKMGAADSNDDPRQRVAQEKGRGVHAPRDVAVDSQTEEALYGGKKVDLSEADVKKRGSAMMPNEFDTARGYSPPPPGSDVTPDVGR